MFLLGFACFSVSPSSRVMIVTPPACNEVSEAQGHKQRERYYVNASRERSKQNREQAIWQGSGLDVGFSLLVSPGHILACPTPQSATISVPAHLDSLLMSLIKPPPRKPYQKENCRGMMFPQMGNEMGKWREFTI